jgi:hypothetical protein
VLPGFTGAIRVARTIGEIRGIKQPALRPARYFALWRRRARQRLRQPWRGCAVSRPLGLVVVLSSCSLSPGVLKIGTHGSVRVFAGVTGRLVAHAQRTAAGVLLPCRRMTCHPDFGARPRPSKFQRSTVRRCLSAPALTTCTRTVWSWVVGASLPRAINRILPSSSASSPNGGDAHPTSIWPDIACVTVTAAAPVEMAFAETPKYLMSASTVMWVEAPLVE